MKYHKKPTNNGIMSFLSMDVDKTKSTKGYITNKSVCNDSGTHYLLCKDIFVHFDISIGGMDKRQK